MVIHVTHKSLRIKANVIYSLLAIKNIVMVRFEQEIPGIEKEIVLLNGPMGWEEINEMQFQNPELFNQIVSRLEAVLQRCSA